jgi:hypothetical protein
MFLTVHGAIGIIIGQRISNPLLAFVVGFISHYIFDIIPHGDTRAPEKWKNIIHTAFAALIDLIILIIFILWLGIKVDILNLNTALAFFGSIIPDFLQGFYFLTNKKKFVRFQEVHNFFHFLLTKNSDFNLLTGMILQTIFFILLITFII